MGKLKQETMIDATEERKNRFNGETVLLTPHEAKIHDDIFINELEATIEDEEAGIQGHSKNCLLYTSPSPRDRQKSRMPSSA